MKQIILNLPDGQVDSIGNYILEQKDDVPFVEFKVTGDNNDWAKISGKVKSMSVTEEGYSIMLK